MAGDPRDPRAILDDYASRARTRGPVVVEATALRTGTVAMRDILAHLASNGRHDFAGLSESFGAGHWDGLDPTWAAALARVIGLQNLLPGDRPAAIEILRRVLPHLTKSRPSRPYRRLLAELLFDDGRYDEAYAHLSADDDLRRLHRGYLETDLLNPYIGSPFADSVRWQGGFGSIFEIADLASPKVTDDATLVPFDRLHLDAPAATIDGPLVSVIMTTFRPERAELLTSVKSIVAQTWGNLEVIIVDDASPAEYSEVLEAACQLDPRIRLIRAERNGGTYLARNTGIAAAQGVLFTGQDADDWSHPRRLELQAAPLLDSEDIPGSRSYCIGVQESLVIQRPGYLPERPNASSLMLRTEMARTLGGFLGARRAADSELHQRVEYYTGRSVLDITIPLALVRILPDSLSRGDFRPGWHHPARRAFRSAYQLWHRKADSAELQLTGGTSPVPVPRRFAIETSPPAHLDVVFAGDWREYGGPQRSMIEEIRALRGQGLRIGILHLEAALFMSQRAIPLCTPIQELINDGTVDRILEDDGATIELLILRFPPILQYPQFQTPNLTVRRMAVLADEVPSERDGSDIRYRVDDCADNAEKLFGLRPLWVPQGPAVRHAIEGSVPEGELADFDMPGIIKVAEWRTERDTFRSNRPVVGRHSRDDTMTWPEHATALRAAYPTDDSVDVRIMGGASAALSVLENAVNPPSWVVFDTDELDIRIFLNSLDFFVYYQHSQASDDAFERAVLEALATGCVAVLPHHFKETFSRAAVYARPEDCMAVVRRLYADPKAYRAQSRRAIDYVDKAFSPAVYQERIATLLAQGALTTRSDEARPVG